VTFRLRLSTSQGRLSRPGGRATAISNHPDADAPEPASAELQELLLNTESVQEFLAELATCAARDLGGARFSCGVTVRTHQRRPTTLGTSDGLAAALDEAQYAAGDGPCLHALRTGDVVEVTDTATDARWPRFSSLCAENGAGSVLSLPLGTAAGGVVGALNIYSRAVAAFGDADREHGRRYAQLVSGAVAIAVRLAQRAELSDDLRAALGSRSVIDQAMGIVMARRCCGPDEAFGVLRERSQTGNVKLRDVAAEIVRTVAEVPLAPT
jgi:hypothetical protein